MNRVSPSVAPPSWTTACSLTASKYSSNLARSWPPGASPNSVNHSLQVYLITLRIAAPKFGWSMPLSESPNSVEQGLTLHLHTRSITAFTSVSNLGQSWPASAAPNSLNISLQVYVQAGAITASKLARSWPPSALQTHTITSSRRISKVAQSQPPSVCPNSLAYGFQTSLITASECISMFTRPQCGETVKLDGRQPIIKTPPHLSWYPTGQLVGNSDSSLRSIGCRWEDM